MRSNVLSKLNLCKLCVILRSRVLWVVCPVGRRLPLQLVQCSYQGQQGDVKSVWRGKYKTRNRMIAEMLGLLVPSVCAGRSQVRNLKLTIGFDISWHVGVKAGDLEIEKLGVQGT